MLLFFLGASAAYSLAPFFYWPLLFISFSSLLWLIVQSPNGRSAFWTGWWFGFGFFVAGLYWFAYALLVDASKFGWMIPFAVFGINGILSIYCGLVAWLTARLRAHDAINWVVGFATIWAGTEWVRGYLLTGFPWNLIGYAFNASEVSLQAASIFGVFGLSWLTVLMACLPVIFMVPAKNASDTSKGRLFAGFWVVLMAALLLWGQHRLDSHPTEMVPEVKLRLVQPAIDQYHKSQPAQRQNILIKESEMSMRAGHYQITHLIWPESAMPFYFSSGDYWAQELSRLVPFGGLLMTGVVRPEVSRDGKSLLHVFNSFSALNSEGNVISYYDKRKLVPFGEFVPFRHILPLDKITPGMLDFNTGKGSRLVQQETGPSFFPLICYESIFPLLSEGAWPSALLNVTNDGWFGLSSGPYQHLEMSRMRGVEQGVALIRAANSGVSAVYDAYGRPVAMLGLGEEGVLDSLLPMASKHQTIYSLYGGNIDIILMLIAVFVLLIRQPENKAQIKTP